MIRVVKACLPFLKESAIARSKAVLGKRPAPRIVNMTSVAGIIAAQFLSPYCASKHAAEVN